MTTSCHTRAPALTGARSFLHPTNRTEPSETANAGRPGRMVRRLHYHSSHSPLEPRKSLSEGELICLSAWNASRRTASLQRTTSLPQASLGLPSSTSTFRTAPPRLHDPPFAL